VPLTLTGVPAGLVLGAIALAERAGAETAVFYLFLVGIAVSAAGGLAAFGRLVDVANGGGTPPLARVQAGLAAALVAVFLVGAVARSPVVLELGAPGLAPAAVVLGFCVLALQALAAAVLAGR
jgi:hypothetical protein